MFYNTVSFLWKSWIKVLHRTEFLIYGLCSPQIGEKWIIVNEEVRRHGAVSTTVVSHELISSWQLSISYSFREVIHLNFINRQHTESGSFHVYSSSVQEKMMSAYSYSLTLETLNWLQLVDFLFRHKKLWETGEHLWHSTKLDLVMKLFP